MTRLEQGRLRNSRRQEMRAEVRKALDELLQKSPQSETLTLLAVIESTLGYLSCQMDRRYARTAFELMLDRIDQGYPFEF